MALSGSIACGSGTPESSDSDEPAEAGSADAAGMAAESDATVQTGLDASTSTPPGDAGPRSASDAGARADGGPRGSAADSGANGAESGPGPSDGPELVWPNDQSKANSDPYANTTGTYSYDTNNPDPEVLSSCENYGLHNGPGGKDLTTPYTNAMTDRLYGRSVRDCPANQPACDDDCGGHGSTYLYQNFPGPFTESTNDDGTPMHNWWVYLFY